MLLFASGATQVDDSGGARFKVTFTASDSLDVLEVFVVPRMAAVCGRCSIDDVDTPGSMLPVLPLTPPDGLALYEADAERVKGAVAVWDISTSGALAATEVAGRTARTVPRLRF